MSSNKELQLIFNKTSGHCHFCGDQLVLNKYGLKSIGDIDGAWELDHVIQKGKGGAKELSNCLPACVQCNRLRWHRSGSNLRTLIDYGITVSQEIKKGTVVGRKVAQLLEQRVRAKGKRRRSPFE